MEPSEKDSSSLRRMVIDAILKWMISSGEKGLRFVVQLLKDKYLDK